ncbi:MAG: hypothetical protein CMO80_02365 [Verrucomicrobiales bacterium]|nr:hypothetical protein [Verrucomicrobiales bacterium]|tara:strand:+ start:979 stop:2016 length:1038 start_codon:yes stop_codon:yes gene_type:complete
MSKPRKFSYAFMALMLVVVASMHLATPLLTVLFCMFALHLFNFGNRKFLASGLLVCLCTAILMGLAYFFNQAVLTTPLILDKLLPVVMEAAEKHNVALPFDSVEGFKDVAIDTLVQQLGLVGSSVEKFLRQAAMVVIGIVVAISLFANSSIVVDNEFRGSQNNLYNMTAEEIGARFRTFYKSFATVMGAQIIISAINTFFTALFIMGAAMPYASLLFMVTFLCGLLPILGNIMSNTIIISVALTLSPMKALAALVFLIVIHKLEYFLNSQIIGKRIRNPMWLTLLALVVGERLMGIAGMILAPVVLHYVKSEASKVRVVRRSKGDDGEEDNLVGENTEQITKVES